MLEQPFQAVLRRAKKVLLAGCGGGYDVFGAIPLLLSLKDAGIEAHLASLSFSYLNGLPASLQEPTVPNLYEVTAASATGRSYCPEAWLARFLDEKLGGKNSVWCFEKTGVIPLKAAYERLIQRLGIDCIVLVDGGIDAVLKGDEVSLGTPSEDLTSVAAVSSLSGVTTLLACVGMTAELRDGIAHSQVLRRIAELTKAGAFLGTSSLLKSTPYGTLYEEAVDYTFKNQEHQRKSHVHTVVCLSMGGDFGRKGDHIWISPLLNQYWFFSLPEVAETNLLVQHLSDTQSIWDVVALIEAQRKSIDILRWQEIPV